MQKDDVANQGFTLIELMIAVAIIGILAAVAIPVYRSYLKEAKASETATVLQGIREREEAYFAEFKFYTPSITWWPYAVGTASNAGVCGVAQNWGVPADQGWINLGFNPAGPTYYTYQVETGYNAAGQLVTQIPVNTPGHPAPANLNPPWYRITAMGDIDCDTVQAYFYVTSYNKTIVKTRGALGTIDSTVY